jgi:general secretion pathway protein M
MIMRHPLYDYLARHPAASTMLYAATFVAFVLTIVFALLDVAQRYQTVEQSSDLLAQLEETPRASRLQAALSERGMPPGSPFLQGPTATVANAALLQRVLAAISRVGGNMVSSAVVPQDTQANGGRYLKVDVTCELKQEDLQPVLYDLEAGMPFLFINRFVVEAAPPGHEGKSMHISLEVSGLWPGAK